MYANDAKVAAQAAGYAMDRASGSFNGSGVIGAISGNASPLDASMSAAFQAFGELAAAVHILVEGIGPVLQPEVPQPVNGANGPREVLPACSQTVTQLQALRAQIEGLTVMVNQTRCRLDS